MVVKKDQILLGRKELIVPIVIYILINLLFTTLGVILYEPDLPIGIFRGLLNIPLKAAQLMGFGILLGLLVSLGQRKVSLKSITYPIFFLILLDLDHLPSFFDIAQLIRPAHSLIFIAAFMVVIYLLYERSFSIPIISLSTFMAALGLDKPLFPLLFPLSTELFSYNLYISFLLILFSLALAWIGGRLSKIEQPFKGGKKEL
jgi:hypothetical protein